MLILLIFWLAFIVFIIASIWKVFTKAGQPGWAAIVPIYNYIIMCKIAQKPTWWTAIILLVPVVNIVFLIMLWHNIVIRFGKTAGFTVGVFLLGFVFVPILGFGSAEYTPIEEGAAA